MSNPHDRPPVAKRKCEHEWQYITTKMTGRLYQCMRCWVEDYFDFGERPEKREGR